MYIFDKLCRSSHGLLVKETAHTPSHPHISTEHQDQLDKRCVTYIISRTLLLIFYSRANQYSLTVSFNEENPPQAILLAPTVTSSPVHYVTSHDPSRRHTKVCSSLQKADECKTVSLPSLGGPSIDPLKGNRQKIVRGTLAHRGLSSIFVVHVSNELSRL